MELNERHIILLRWSVVVNTKYQNNALFSLLMSPNPFTQKNGLNKI